MSETIHIELRVENPEHTPSSELRAGSVWVKSGVTTALGQRVAFVALFQRLGFIMRPCDALQVAAALKSAAEHALAEEARLKAERVEATSHALNALAKVRMVET